MFMRCVSELVIESREVSDPHLTQQGNACVICFIVTEYNKLHYNGGFNCSPTAFLWCHSVNDVVVVTVSRPQFDMLLGRLEKDGSRKVGRWFYLLYTCFTFSPLSLRVFALFDDFSSDAVGRSFPLFNLLRT